MSNFKFVVNDEGLKELMKSEAAQNIVNGYGAQVLAYCGDGYEMQNGIGVARAGSRVVPATPHAYYSNRKHKTLQKALGSVTVS